MLIGCAAVAFFCSCHILTCMDNLVPSCLPVLRKHITVSSTHSSFNLSLFSMCLLSGSSFRSTFMSWRRWLRPGNDNLCLDDRGTQARYILAFNRSGPGPTWGQLSPLDPTVPPLPSCKGECRIPGSCFSREALDR